MEDRSSITTDSRVQFVPVPSARRLMVLRHDTPNVMVSAFKGTIVWVDPEGRGEGNVEGLVEELRRAGAAAVRVLPAAPVDAPLPAAAETREAGPSDVRPIVLELLEQVPSDVRPAASALCERLMSKAGL